jgi:lysophospholipase L1-like esterase
VAGLILLGIAGLVLAAEAVLQAASLLVGDRASHWRAGASVRILALGDSHTYGTSIPEDQSYPAQLQRLLDERMPGRFSVINLGIPGMSTTQVRRRLPAHVARYGPDIVLVWCGANNVWNSSELEGTGVGAATQLDALALRSRLYRLLRVWQHSRAIEASVGASVRSDGVRQEAERPHWQPEGEGRGATWKLRHAGGLETIRTYHDPARDGEDLGARSYEDFKAMSAWLRAAGARLVLVRYPIARAWPFKGPNEAMERVAREDGVPIIDTTASVTRVPRTQREWVSGAHPGPNLYREIASDLVPVVLELAGDEPPPPGS